MVDVVDIGFDYWYKILKKNKDEKRKREKLKIAFGWCDNEVIEPNLINKKIKDKKKSVLI